MLLLKTVIFTEIQGYLNVPAHLMITVQKAAKIF
jgi:hypothetical protein